MKLKHIFFTLAAMALFSTAQAQVKVGANPGTIESTSALEVEATNGNKTTINKTNGQVTIKDGTQGANKVLTSDANGMASWQVVKSQTTNTFVAVTGGVAQQINLGNNVVSFASETLDEGNNYNPATSTFTVPENGIYYINSYITVSGQPQYQLGRIGVDMKVSINGNPGITLSAGIAYQGDWGYSGGGTLLRLVAGQQIQIMLIVASGGSTGQQRTLEPSRHFEIMKMSN